MLDYTIRERLPLESHFRKHISAVMFGLVYRYKLQREASHFGVAGHTYIFVYIYIYIQIYNVLYYMSLDNANNKCTRKVSIFNHVKPS